MRGYYARPAREGDPEECVVMHHGFEFFVSPVDDQGRDDNDDVVPGTEFASTAHYALLWAYDEILDGICDSAAARRTEEMFYE